MAFVTASYTVATLAEALFQWKEDAVTNGVYTVASSSDGTTYNPSGDQVTGPGAGAGGFDNDSAWIRLVSTDGKRELILQHGIGDPDTMFGWFSYGSNPFTGGSPDATTPPTATDAVQFAFGSFAGALPGGPYALTIGVDTAAPYSTYMTFLSGGVPYFGFLFQAVSTAGDPAVMQVLDAAGSILASGNLYSPPYAWNTLITLTALTSAGGGGPSDVTAPTISTFTPSTGSSMTRTHSIAVDVTDDTALGSVHIWGELADGTRLLVYDGAAFVGIFAAGSTLSSEKYTIIPDAPGWPSSSVTITVYAVDAAGNDATATASYTISDPPAAPTVGPFSPTDGGNTTRTGTVTIDVTDDEGRTALALVTIDVTLASGQVVTAYNGAAFPGPLAAGSSRSNITNGYRYSLVYGGAGWPSSTLAYRITATDTQGRTTTHTTYNLVIIDPPTAPTIGSWNPAAGPRARADYVAFNVASPDDFASVVVWAVLGNGSTVLVYDGAAFGPEVDAVSGTEGDVSRDYYIVHDGAGWTDDYTLHVRATDTLGQTSTATQAYTLTDAPEPVVVDTTPPQISALTPADTSEVPKNQAVRFNVTDNVLLRRIFVFVNMGSTDEVIWNGTAFTAKYAGGSTITETEGGFAFVVLRSGGWVSSPTFTIHPFDTSGNEA